MGKIFVTLAVMAFAAAVNAQEGMPKAFVLCMAHKVDAERLACFDEATKAAILKDATDRARPQVHHGSWLASTESDKLDGTRSFSVITLAAENFGVDRPALLVRCRKNLTEVLLGTQKYLGNRAIPVRWRVDDAPIRSEYWNSAVGGRSAFAPQAIAFAKGLFGKRELILGVTPYGEVASTLSFSIEGAEEALADLRKGCGW